MLFIVGIILFAVGIAAIFIKLENDYGNKEGLHPLIGAMIIVLALAFVVMSFVRIVPRTTVGIPVTFGSAGDEVSGGINIVTPFTSIREFPTTIQSIQLVDERKQIGDSGEDCKGVIARGSDGFIMCVDITVNWYLEAGKAREIFNRVRSRGGDMEAVKQAIVIPETREAVRVAFERYTAEEGYSSKLAEIGEEIQVDLEKRLAYYGLKIDKVLVPDAAPTLQLSEYITKRAVAKEGLLQASIEQERQNKEAETRRQVAEKDAESLRLKAQGEADAALIAAQAQAASNFELAQSITPTLVDYIRANALATANTIYVPSDSTLLIGAGTTQP